jgi:signal transduction histidine kinase
MAGSASAVAPRRPRLRTLLLVVNVLILILPLGSIAVLRLYENELVRRTENSLIGQAAILASTYRRALHDASGDTRSQALDGYGRTIDPRWRPDASEALRPVPPRLDLTRDELLPPAEDARATEDRAAPVAMAAGEALGPVLAEVTRVTLAGLRVVDPGGVVVASSRGEVGQSLAHRVEVQRALAGEPVSLLRQRVSDQPPPSVTSISRRTRVRVFVAYPILLGERVVGAVVLSRTPIDIQKALYLNRARLVPAGLVLLGVVLLVTLLVTLSLSRPVKALIRQTQAVGRGERGAAAPLTRPGTAEVAQLSHAFAHMARALEERADYIQAFARSVSHEFKTPLTSLKGSVELVREHGAEMSPEERARFLDMMDGDINRLDRLVRRLLEMARADMATPGDGRARARPVLERQIARARRARADVEVTLEIAPELGEVAMDEETLETLAANLVDNALQHGGAPLGRLDVTARAERDAGAAYVVLRVADDGQGVSEANADRIFQPFFTTAREAGGSGLGLSIVRALLDAHGGRLEHLPTEHGATFEAWLPAAD